MGIRDCGMDDKSVLLNEMWKGIPGPGGRGCCIYQGKKLRWTLADLKLYPPAGKDGKRGSEIVDQKGDRKRLAGTDETIA